MMTVTRCITESQEETMALAGRLTRALKPGDIIALEGSLGAGKTCFVRGLARGLGIDPQMVSSPTFITCQEYASPESRDPKITLVHIDAYRLHGPGDMDIIGWDELLSSRAIIAVEWPSKVRSALPPRRCIDVTIDHVGPSTRAISVSTPPELASRLEGLND